MHRLCRPKHRKACGGTKLKAEFTSSEWTMALKGGRQGRCHSCMERSSNRKACSRCGEPIPVMRTRRFVIGNAATGSARRAVRRRRSGVSSSLSATGRRHAADAGKRRPAMSDDVAGRDWSKSNRKCKACRAEERSGVSGSLHATRRPAATTKQAKARGEYASVRDWSHSDRKCKLCRRCF